MSLCLFTLLFVFPCLTMQRYGKSKWRESKQWQKMKIMPIYLINVKSFHKRAYKIEKMPSKIKKLNIFDNAMINHRINIVNI